MVVGEVDEEILCGHQLHDRVAQELHPLVVAPGNRKQHWCDDSITEDGH